MPSPGHNNSAQCSILICGPLGRRIVCNKSIEGASNETFERIIRGPGALQSIRRDDSKRSFTVTYHTLTVTVVRISNLYQACYRCALPGKTALTFPPRGRNLLLLTEARVQCSFLATDIRPVPANPSCRAAAAMCSYQLLPAGRNGVREIRLRPFRISSRDVSRIMHCRSTANPL